MTQETSQKPATESEGPELTLATLQQSPLFRAAIAMAALDQDSSAEYIAEALVSLEKQCQSTAKGDLDRLEAMLTTQAHVLDSIFNKYVRTAQKAELLEQFSGYMSIALKAQTQCRQSIGALRDLRDPKRTTFIKQQNNAVNQQINQDDQAQAGTEVTPQSQQELLEKTAPCANELLETRIERMDDRAPAETK